MFLENIKYKINGFDHKSVITLSLLKEQMIAGKPDICFD
jgi:hypothetical protein